jgi:microcystin degradation protein MlrC
VTKRRLAVARFWYEGNAFAPLPADMRAFERCEWTSGARALAMAEGTATELGAVAAFAQRYPYWEVVTLRCASALPAGPIADAVFDRFVSEVGDDLRAGCWDAVYLSLHGAAITVRRQTPDLDLVREVRTHVPGVPLGASFDLHGNMAPELASLLDVASVYRTHPHTDMAETATRVLDQLVACADGTLTTKRALLNDGLLLPSFNMRTGAGPMRELEVAARELTAGALREVAVFGGFPYSDTIHTGASVLAISDAGVDPEGRAAALAARALMHRMHELAPAFEARLPGAAEAIATALASSRPGLVAITDPADNPLSGGAADTPGLLRALLDARVSVPTLFASFADPIVVDIATRAGVGASVAVKLGARFGTHFGDPVSLCATVEHVTDGTFRNTGPFQTGVERHCGTSVVLVVDAQPLVRIVVTEEVVPADDPAFFALHHIDLGALRLLCVKAKNHFRAAFEALCSEIIACDSPGPACADLRQLPFRNVRLPGAANACR